MSMQSKQPSGYDPNLLARQCIFFYTPVILAGLLWEKYFNWPYLHIDNLFNWPQMRTGILTGLAIVIATQLGGHFFKPLQRMEDVFRRILEPLSVGRITIYALFSGFAEEMLFRGILQHHLGLAVAAVLFGLAHFPVEKSLRIWTLFALAIGFLFGYIMDESRNLYPLIAAHFMINFGNMLFMMLRRYDSKATPDDGQHSENTD